jgi:two-component system, chemotaxis family, protein-glutamate methylesterase/glutaminase
MGSELRANLSVKTLIAFGASTGGTDALRFILEAMPADAPGMVIVQHIHEGFTAMFADSLNRSCQIEVRRAQAGDVVRNGLALIAPANYHMRVLPNADGYFVELSTDSLVSLHRPSVDVLFESVARAAGANALGIILTGMGSDGAAGLLLMKKAGAHTIAQDESSSVAFSMPEAAIRNGAAQEILPLSDIAAAILRLQK